MCPAITINEQRTKANRHYCFSCRIVNPRNQYEDKSKCFLMCVPGSPPEGRLDVESPMEKYPKKIILLILNHAIGKVVITLLFLAYLGSSIYGCINLQQGLQLFNLVSKDSYFYKYSTWDENYFTTEPIITLCVTSEQEYHRTQTQDIISSLLSRTKMDSYIDNNVEINWLTSYKQSAVYNSATESGFVTGLKSFLSTQSGQSFENDVVFDSSGLKIRSSKFYVKANNMKTSNEQGDFMKRMREITDNAAIPSILYTPAFVFFEQYVEILPSTLQTLGIAIAAMLVVTFVFMPDFRVVVIVCITLVSILSGIMGFMYYWDLTLSSITMIHLVMSVGFSVDFSVHICHAFMSVGGNDRITVLKNAIDRAGGPVVNAAFSTLLGIVMLAFSGSYIFQSFGILMFLVIGFGLIHAAFFLPLSLYVLLPCFHSMDNRRVIDSSTETKARRASSVHIWTSSDNANDKKANGAHTDMQISFTNGDQPESFSRPNSSKNNFCSQPNEKLRNGKTTDIGDGYMMYKPQKSNLEVQMLHISNSF
jgi:predicted RND superfamily exporter protein